MFTNLRIKWPSIPIKNLFYMQVCGSHPSTHETYGQAHHSTNPRSRSQKAYSNHEVFMISLVTLSIENWTKTSFFLFYSSSPKVFFMDDDLKTSRYERIINLPTIVTPTSPILQQITHQVKVLNDVVVSSDFFTPFTKNTTSNSIKCTKTTSVSLRNKIEQHAN